MCVKHMNDVCNLVYVIDLQC